MDEVTQLRKLRAVESAAASAVLNGCDPAEVLRRVEVGIAEATRINGRGGASASAERSSNGHMPQQGSGMAVSAEGALDAWTNAVGDQRAA